MTKTPGSGPTGELSLEQQALRAVRTMRQRLESVERAHNEPIAVIGMACRFPGSADTPERFWELLRDGRDVVGPIPKERWDVMRYFDQRPGAPGRMYVRHGAFVDAIDQFDAAFFGISPREANAHGSAAAAPAGGGLGGARATPASRSGSLPRSGTGVFVALYGDDYSHLQGDRSCWATPTTVTGNIHSAAAGRISYLLRFQGSERGRGYGVLVVAGGGAPGRVRACARGECDMALAGGVNLILAPDVTSVLVCSSQALAADGRCKTFDAARRRLCAGRRLRRGGAQAAVERIADGDRDSARVIRGSAVNQDGRERRSDRAERASQQAGDPRARLRNARRRRPADVGYVEAHGTGTSLGDPIEVEALASGARRGRARTAAAARSASVKTNIGHTEAAAGIAGLIKAVLALEHEADPAESALPDAEPAHLACRNAVLRSDRR